MIPRPPRLTLTYTLFPSTTLFRSQHRVRHPDSHPRTDISPLLPLARRVLPAYDGTRGQCAQSPHQSSRHAMNFRKTIAADEPEMNLIPLIDVLLVILIFLAASTSFTQVRQLKVDRKSTRLNSSHSCASRIPSPA